MPHNSHLTNKETSYDSYLMADMDPCFLEFTPWGIIYSYVGVGPSGLASNK